VLAVAPDWGALRRLARAGQTPSGASGGAGQTPDGDICGICREPLNDGVTTSPCSHKFASLALDSGCRTTIRARSVGSECQLYMA
jgi:hypothetical protein